MNFAYAILYVENVEETLKFYEKAFGFKCRFLYEAGDYGELESGATVLAFAERKMIATEGLTSPEKRDPSPDFEIDFTTDDVIAAVEQAVQAGAQLMKEPEIKPWGQTVAYLLDNNGFLVSICTPVPSKPQETESVL